MNIDFNSITATVGQLLALAATVAAVVAVLKAFGVSLPSLPGTVEHWAWVCIACAAAKYAR